MARIFAFKCNSLNQCAFSWHISSKGKVGSFSSGPGKPNLLHSDQQEMQQARTGGGMEKEMATHSSVLAWRIPGTGEPSGLPSMGSHRVGHD